MKLFLFGDDDSKGGSIEYETEEKKGLKEMLELQRIDAEKSKEKHARLTPAQWREQSACHKRPQSLPVIPARSPGCL